MDVSVSDVYSILRGYNLSTSDVTKGHISAEANVHPGVHELIQKLITDYAIPYRNLKHFAKDHGSTSMIQKSLKNTSFKCKKYLASFCFGLEKALKPYCEILLFIEKQNLNLEESVLRLHSVLLPYKCVLESLQQCIDTICKTEACGGELLTLLWNKSQGPAPVSHTYACIFASCIKTLQLHIDGWLLSAKVTQDPGAEFFIQILEDDPDKMNTFKTHRVISALKPCFITERLANSILFIGHCINLFRREQQSDFEEWEKMYEKEVLVGVSSSLQYSQRREWSAPIQISKLEDCISSLKIRVENRLWTLLVNEANFLIELENVLDLFLLREGDVFMRFYDHCNPLLALKPEKHFETQVTSALHKIYDSTTSINQFTIELPASDITGDKSCVGWDMIRLKYNLKWPLTLLISDNILNYLNDIFMHLVRLRRLQVRLDQSWLLHKLMAHVPESVKVRLCEVRGHLMFLIGSFQSFMFLHVISPRYSVLKDSLSKCTQYEQALNLLNQFICDLRNDSCLTQPALMQPINAILKCAETCCDVQHLITGDVKNSTVHLDKIQRLYSQVQKQCALLFTVLRAMKQKQYSSLLNSLLLKMDFNSYYNSFTIISDS